MKKMFFLSITALLGLFNLNAQVVNGTLSHGGINRTYLAYLPTSYAPGSSLPVVFVLHALTMNGQRIMQVSGMNAVAEANNFIAVYPDGIGGSWNTSLPVPGASTADDVGFIDALADEMVTLYNADLNRLYACGLSNGAFLSYRLACESSKCFAAIAPVAGSLTDANFANCAPSRAVPVLHIHGTADLIVPFGGTVGIKPVNDVLAYWLFSNNNCSGNPTVTALPNTNPFDGSTVDRWVWSPCDNGAEVQLLKVNGGGHQWPGTFTLLGGLGNINRDINASQEIWNFFSRFTCSQSGANPIPPAPIASASPNPICLGTATTLTATAPGGNYEWFNTAIGGTPIATGTTFTTPALFVTTTYWVQTTVGADVSARTPVVVTVDLNPQPLAPIVIALPPSLCSSGSAVLTSTVPILGTINWYDAATGGNLLATGPIFTTPALNATTTYWAEPSRGGCLGPRTAVTVTVNPVPAAPTATASPATLCYGNSSTLTATGGAGIFTWFNSPAGGIPIWVGASYTTLPLLNTTTFYVQETDASGCTSARTAVTVTVNPLPAAPTASASPASICSGTSTTLTATAPGGTYDWYDLPIGGTLLGTGATFTTPALNITTIYWVQTTDSNGCVSTRTAVTVTVEFAPLAPIVTALPSTICAGGTSVLVSTVPILGAINWYDAATGGNLLGTGPLFTTPALTTTITYWAEPVRGSCAGPRTAVTVTVNPVPAAPTATASPATLCYGNSSTLTATGGAGIFTWFNSPAGGIPIWVGASHTTLPLLNTTTFYVQETDASGCTSARTAVTVTVNPLPAAPTASASPASICSGTSTTLTATAPGGTYDWYDLPIGGTLLGTGATFTTPALNITTIYWVQTTDANGCVSPRTAVTVTVEFAPLAPIVTALPSTICAGGTSVLVSTVPILGAINWYDAATGGNLLATGPIFSTPALNATTTYWAEPSRGGCLGPRTAVTVTVNPVPAAPTATASPATLCYGNSSTLTATGGAGIFTWFNSPAGGIPIWVGASYTTLPLLNTTTFYVQETDASGCTSARTAVTVTVNPLPAAPTASASPASICSGNTTTLTATAPGGTYDWFDVPFGGVSLGTGASFTTPVLNFTTIYWVQTTDANGCVSPRTAVSVPVSRTPFAPSLAARPSTICAGNTAILIARNPLGVINWYDAATGGNLVGTGRVLTTPPLSVTTTYYADITLGACTGPRSSITITVNPVPVAPTVTAPATICYGTTATMNATAPGGFYTWYIVPTGGIPIWFGANYTTLPLFSTTTYYVQTNSQGCISPRTAVVINVDPLVIPPKLTAVPNTVCPGGTTTLNAIVSGGTVDWYDVPSGGVPIASGINFTTPPLSSSTTFYATVTVNGCVSGRSSVFVSVTQAPAPIVTPIPLIVCTGWSSVLTVSFPLLATINWYDAATGGNLLGSGLVFTTPPVTATTTYYAEASIGGCAGVRTPVTVILGPCKMGDNSSNIEKEANDASLAVYPNPTEGRINVDFIDNSVTAMQLRIFDASGKVIYRDENSLGDNSEYHNTIDLETYPKGVYILQITTASYSLNRKVVVQ